MDTPIVDFIDGYVKRNAVRLHMPGHKGKGGGANERDITEVHGADVLSCPTGVIAKSRENAAKIFGAAKTLYSCEGATLAIKTMLSLAVRYAASAGKKPLILAGRNAHRSFVDGAALIGFDVEWITGESLLKLDLPPEKLDGILSRCNEKPIAVYVTSPDYLGNMLDVAGLAAVCKKHDVLLLVDNAHGAYLKFLKRDMHPITLGADMCADSAHKTLPALTGTAYLHLNERVNAAVGRYADGDMGIFASTSPSYLLLASLDKLNAVLDGGFKQEVALYVDKLDILKKRITALGYKIAGDEPLKLTVLTKPYGYMGEEVASYLRDRNAEVEYGDGDHVVMMFTPYSGEEALSAVLSAFEGLEKRPPIKDEKLTFSLPERVLPIRAAAFALSEKKPVNEVIGRVFTGSSLSCPPCVPVLIAGERIDENAAKALKYYGIKEVEVIK